MTIQREKEAAEAAKIRAQVRAQEELEAAAAMRKAGAEALMQQQSVEESTRAMLRDVARELVDILIDNTASL